MPEAEPNRTRPRAAVEVVERLQVLWIVSCLALFVLIALLALVETGWLRRQARTLAQQAATIESLRQRVDQMQRSLDELQRELAARSARPPEPPATPPAAPARPAAPAAAAPTAAPPAGIADERVLSERLDALLSETPGAQPSLSDAAAATALLDEVRSVANQAAWGGATWSRLALLAALLNQDEMAAAFAARARRGGTVPADYEVLRIRRLLAAGRIEDAREAALRLHRALPTEPTVRVLLAAAQLAAQEPAEADATLTPVPDPGALEPADRLRLAQTLAALQRWKDLERTLRNMPRLPQPQQVELNRLRAILTIQRGEYAAGVAILDALLGSRPDDEDLRVWRAAALLKAGQVEAARAALPSPESPASWYWSGRLSLVEGDTDAAREAFLQAVDADVHYAPALESLGILALNEKDVEQALMWLTRATRARPHSASAHFLLAIAQAKAGRRDEAAAALRVALQTDPDLLGTARETPAFRALFTDEDLRGMLPTAETQPNRAD